MLSSTFEAHFIWNKCGSSYLSFFLDSTWRKRWQRESSFQLSIL